jgi:5-epi-alpha-selinene synthase
MRELLGELPGESLVIPKIPCPFPSGISPHLEMVEQHMLLWIKRFGLVRQEAAWRYFLACKFAHFPCRCHPRADLRTLCICVDFYNWLWLYDDQLDQRTFGKQPEQMRTLQDQLLVVLQGSHHPSHTQAGFFVRAFADIWQRIAVLTSSLWQQRFSYHLSDLFSAVLQEALNRQHKRIPTVEEYMSLRRRVSAVDLLFDMISLTGLRDIPVEIYEDPCFGAILQGANDIICWKNDVGSLQKELASGEVHNLILSLQQEDHLSLQEAVNQACSLLRQQIQHTEELLSGFQTGPSDCDLRQFLADEIRSLIRGNMDWVDESGRYVTNAPLSPGQESNYLEDILLD